MKSSLIIIITAIVSSLVTIKIVKDISDTRIEKLISQINEVKNENDLLYKKLDIIRSNFEEVKKYKKPIITKNSKNKTKNQKVQTEEVYVVEGMEKFEKVMDSIKSTLPNRTGQDLINSLKIKTEL